jgi:copper resistance protein C
VKTAGSLTAFGRRASTLLVLSAVAATATLAALSATSFAHNAVVATTPQAGGVVTTSPVDVRIVTSDTLLDLGGTGAGFAIIVQDDEGSYFGDGCVDVGSTDFAARADLGGAGDYLVTYQFVSADSHSLSDGFSFRFEPGASHVPVDGVINPPVCGGGVEPETLDEPTGNTTTDVEGAPPSVVAEPSQAVIAADNDENQAIIPAIVGVLIVLSITLVVWMIKRRNGL